MEDGYWNNSDQTILFCTECFTKKDTLFLIEQLSILGIKATLSIRNKGKETYRIRISKKSVPLLRSSVTPHMHPYFMYKLGND